LIDQQLRASLDLRRLSYAPEVRLVEITRVEEEPVAPLLVFS